MKTTSRKARTIQALLMLGAVEQSPQPARRPQSRVAPKYRVFDTKTQRIFVGRSGALRLASRGDSPSKSQSITGSPAHRHLATLGEYSATIANPREVFQHIRHTS